MPAGPDGIRERQNPLIPVAETCRRVVWMSLADPIWASGHRLASKAGHMIAFEPRPISRKPLEPYGPFSNRVSLVNSLLLTSATCLLYTSPSPRDRQKSRM